MAKVLLDPIGSPADRALDTETFAAQRAHVSALNAKLQHKRDTADVTEVLKELHRIVNEAIRAAAPGEDHAEGLASILTDFLGTSRTAITAIGVSSLWSRRTLVEMEAVARLRRT